MSSTMTTAVAVLAAGGVLAGGGFGLARSVSAVSAGTVPAFAGGPLVVAGLIPDAILDGREARQPILALAAVVVLAFAGLRWIMPDGEQGCCSARTGRFAAAGLALGYAARVASAPGGPRFRSRAVSAKPARQHPPV